MEAHREKYVRLARKQKLQGLVAKRLANFKYLKMMHEGGHYWLNTVEMSSDFIHNYISSQVPSARTINYFYLGLGMAKVLRADPGYATTKAFMQLMEEYDYFISGTGMQSVKFVMAKTSFHPFPDLVFDKSDSENGLKKFNGEILYEILETPHVPFALDYKIVLGSLCELASELYARITHSDNYNEGTFNTIMKLDDKIKHHVISAIAKELSKLAEERISDGIAQLCEGDVSSLAMSMECR
jgi:hypothetical protein